MKNIHVITTEMKLRNMGGSGRHELTLVLSIESPDQVPEVFNHVKGLLEGTDVAVPPVDGEDGEEEKAEPKKPRRRGAAKAEEKEEEEEEKPKPRRRRGAAKAEEKEEEESEEESEEEKEKPRRRRRGTAKKDEDEGPTKEDISKAASRGAEELGPDLTGDIIAEFSEEGTLDGIPADKRQAFINEIEKEIALPVVED